MKSRLGQLMNDVYPGGERNVAGAEPPRPPPEGSGLAAGLLPGLVIAVASLVVAMGLIANAVASAKTRLVEGGSAAPKVATAQEAEVAYCTADFKQVLERVLHSCGLSTQTERRGCQPSDIKTFAAIDDNDFNALFHPLKDRGGVLLFDEGSDVLDETGQKLLEERWFERKGARYFFVVARASKTGTAAQNRALSHRRANSVMFHLQKVSGESEEELSAKVGLLWLGNEYAQLSGDYCAWPRSRSEAECEAEAVNRSAFVSWVDCRL